MPGTPEEDFVQSGKLKNRYTVEHPGMGPEWAERVQAVTPWEREHPGGFRMGIPSGIFVQLDGAP